MRKSILITFQPKGFVGNVGMKFRYTRKIPWLLAALSLFVPWTFSIQPMPFGGVALTIIGSFWMYVSLSESGVFISPLISLIYLPFWGPGLYVAKIAFDQVRDQKSDVFQYSRRIATVLIIQLILIVLFGFGHSGHPEPIDIPLPVVGLVAILLRGFTVREVQTPWESKTTELNV
jgi:hypothetical protein